MITLNTRYFLISYCIYSFENFCFSPKKCHVSNYSFPVAPAIDCESRWWNLIQKKGLSLVWNNWFIKHKLKHITEARFGLPYLHTADTNVCISTKHWSYLFGKANRKKHDRAVGLFFTVWKLISPRTRLLMQIWFATREDDNIWVSMIVVDVYAVRWRYDRVGFIQNRSPVKVSYELSSVTLESYLYSASFIAILCMASLYIWPLYNGTWQDIVFTRYRCICKHHVAFRYQFGLIKVSQLSWWRYQMETFSALLALCAGNSPVTGEFPAQRPVTRSFDVFVDLRSNTRLIE